MRALSKTRPLLLIRTLGRNHLNSSVFTLHRACATTSHVFINVRTCFFVKFSWHASCKAQKCSKCPVFLSAHFLNRNAQLNCIGPALLRNARVGTRKYTFWSQGCQGGQRQRGAAAPDCGNKKTHTEWATHPQNAETQGNPKNRHA